MSIFYLVVIFMVNFTNIIFDEEWIYSDAYDMDFNVSGKIKVHRKKEIFETDCTSVNQFKQASWILRRYVNKGEVNQNGQKKIVWY